MVGKFDDCVGCGLPCIGDACQYKNLTLYTCDQCGEEVGPDDLYNYGPMEVCMDCLLELSKIRR